MAKGNKSSGTTRLPEELKAELRKEQAPYLSRGLEAPSFGALLIVAWTAYNASLDSLITAATAAKVSRTLAPPGGS